MRTATIELESNSPLCQSRYHGLTKESSETHDAFEKRIWPEKAHWSSDAPDANLVISPFAFKNCLSSAAGYLGLKKKGQQTWTKNFKSGIMVLEGVPLDVTRKTIKSVPILCSADGKPGAGSRVVRYFPIVHQWAGTLTVYVTDDTIPVDIFQQVVESAGKFIGIGSFRIQNGGTNGQFRVKNIKWTEA